MHLFGRTQIALVFNLEYALPFATNSKWLVYLGPIFHANFNAHATSISFQSTQNNFFNC